MTGPTPIDAAGLLARWRAAGHLSAEATPAVVAEIVDAARDREPPIHLKLLTAVGTFFATVFFLGFLTVSKLVDLDGGAGLFVWGAAFLVAGMAGALATRRAAVGLGRDFGAQSAFVALALGKVLIVVAALEIWGRHTPGVATIALLGVTVLTYPVAGSSLDRVLSPYAVAASALYDLIERSGDTGFGLIVYHLAATAVAGGLLLPHRVPRGLRPIGLAALGAMGTVVCILASGHDFGIWVNGHPLDPRPIEAILTLSLLGLVVVVAGGFARMATPPMILVVLGVVAVGLAGAPGLIFAVMLLVFGHARHDGPLQVVGILALPAFLVLWYYGRDMTFLVKSATLVGSGAVLLAARGVMAMRGWDREDDR